MKIFLIVLSVVLLVLIITLIYYGAFKKVIVRVEIQGGETLVYQDVLGDYKQSSVISDKVYYSLIENMGITTYKGFGIYYDKPGSVPVEQMRSKVGCILEDSDLDKIDSVKKVFSVEVANEKEYIVAEFPIKGKLSFILGIFKVYPEINRFTKANNFSEDSPVMEIWDIPNKKIIYRKEK